MSNIVEKDASTLASTTVICHILRKVRTRQEIKLWIKNNWDNGMLEIYFMPKHFILVAFNKIDDRDKSS